jgi:thiosulfate dehydrogenase [quinone] large subunit
MRPEDRKTDSTQPALQHTAERAPAPAVADPATGSKILAVLRITTGLVFLWAFVDKAFGWGYATASEKAWFNGGSPTKGFLSEVHVGPFAGALRSWAGQWWADSLFMLGLLGIAVALLLGIGLRLAAAAGTLMLVLMWAAEWPLARFTESGVATRSTNPIIDYHIVYAIVLILLAAVCAGDKWGLGRKWAALTGDRRWLR